MTQDNFKDSMTEFARRIFTGNLMPIARPPDMYTNPKVELKKPFNISDWDMPSIDTTVDAKNAISDVKITTGKRGTAKRNIIKKPGE